MFRPSHPQAKRRHQGGNSLTEYLIIAGLVAITALGVITLFGKDLKHMFGSQPSKDRPAKVQDPAAGGAAMGASSQSAPAGMSAATAAGGAAMATQPARPSAATPPQSP